MCSWRTPGKTVRATSKQASPVHLLSCYDVTTGTVLWQCNVAEKQNEISALKPLITPALVKGRILSLDAMHTRALSYVPKSSALAARTCSRLRTINLR